MNRTDTTQAAMTRLVAALKAAHTPFEILCADRDGIAGVAYHEPTREDGLVFDVLVLPDDQHPAAGRYLFRHIDCHPLHVPGFILRTDDVDAVVDAVARATSLKSTA